MQITTDNKGHSRVMSLTNKKEIFQLNGFNNDDSDISYLGGDEQKPKRENRKGANPNLAKHDGCTPLWIAASRGNSERMEPLINYGADLNKPDRSQGATPLFVACQNGKKSSVDLLLAANSDVIDHVVVMAVMEPHH